MEEEVNLKSLDQLQDIARKALLVLRDAYLEASFNERYKGRKEHEEYVEFIDKQIDFWEAFVDSGEGSRFSKY